MKISHGFGLRAHNLTALFDKTNKISKDFVFIAKTDDDPYFIGETKLSTDCTEWTEKTRLKDGWGLFEGKTNIPYKGYTGELPRDDQDTASFEEFDIYYKGKLLDENQTCLQILSIIRDNKIENILK